MRDFKLPVWKKAPFARLLIPVIGGILIEWYLQPGLKLIGLAAVCFLVAFIAFRLLPLSARFKFQALQGCIINLLLLATGLFITWQKDVRHNYNWYGNVYHDSDYIIARIDEPLVEKSRSYKASAVITQILRNGEIKNVTGKILIYFEKDSSEITDLQYGDIIIFNRPPRQIKNSGNPGAFNFRQYSAFNGVFHNVFLKKGQWVLAGEKNSNGFRQFLFNARRYILNILAKNMRNRDDQLAIAEALLIGYTQDLDKDLVQAYSNTGVVHIIAISGMHLGLIYVMLVWLFGKIPFIKHSKILKVIFILSCLWLFALLTGAAASILRSAVMFSCIVIGQNLGRRASIYNSLAASAFLLLCYNPYFLWDVGFQLSYFAVLGIVIFQKRVYHLFYLKNKWTMKIWELVSVTLAAQIFTFPICLYYFHQFPTLFLVTNILLVPFSTLLLFIEIFLVAVSWIPVICVCMGTLTWWLVWLMNITIVWFNKLPFAVWGGISLSVGATILLYGFVTGTGYWLLNKSKKAFAISLFSLFCFAGSIVYNRWQMLWQNKLIVYNVPQHQAIDFIRGGNYKFIGDSALLADGQLQNFHLKPARIVFHLGKIDSMPALQHYDHFWFFGGKKIALLNHGLVYKPLQQKINVDCIVISGNPKLYILQLAQVFNCKLFVFDGSNSLWKIAKWKKDCEQLNLRCYSVPDEGAFVLDL